MAIIVDMVIIAGGMPLLLERRSFPGDGFGWLPALRNQTSYAFCFERVALWKRRPA